MRLMTGIFAAALMAATSIVPAKAAGPELTDWAALEKAATGQTVYFNAWGGSENINAYLEWVGAEMQSRYGVTVVQVKLEDTASAVAKVIADAGHEVTGLIRDPAKRDALQALGRSPVTPLAVAAPSSIQVDSLAVARVLGAQPVAVAAPAPATAHPPRPMQSPTPGPTPAYNPKCGCPCR